MGKSYSNLLTGGIPPEQMKEAKFKAQSWLTGCFVFFTMNVASKILFDSFWFSLLILIPPFIFCCSRYMMCKGYTWTWGLMGIFSVLGLIFLTTMPYKTSVR